MHWNELRELCSRLERILATFGHSREETADISAFVRLWFTPNNVCLAHLRDLLSGANRHGADFYMDATSSCDETSWSVDQMGRRRSHEEVFGDWMPADGSSIKKRPVGDRVNYRPLAIVEERNAFWQQVFN